MVKEDNSAIDFERSLNELESLVSALEKGDLSLEESLKTFERGVKLTHTCQTTLKDAEQRVHKLLENDDGDYFFEEFGEE